MKPENIISPAQARLNFVNKDYEALYKEINKEITLASRTQSYVSVKTDVDSHIRDRVLQDLSDVGFKVDFFFSGSNENKKLFTITIKW